MTEGFRYGVFRCPVCDEIMEGEVDVVISITQAKLDEETGECLEYIGSRDIWDSIQNMANQEAMYAALFAEKWNVLPDTYRPGSVTVQCRQGHEWVTRKIDMCHVE